MLIAVLVLVNLASVVQPYRVACASNPVEPLAEDASTVEQPGSTSNNPNTWFESFSSLAVQQVSSAISTKSTLAANSASPAARRTT